MQHPKNKKDHRTSAMSGGRQTRPSTDMQRGQGLYDNSYLQDNNEVPQETWPSDDQSSYNRTDNHGISSDHTTFWPDRNTPQFPPVTPLLPTGLDGGARSLPLPYNATHYQPALAASSNTGVTGPDPSIVDFADVLYNDNRYSQSVGTRTSLGDFIQPSTTIDQVATSSFNPLSVITWGDEAIIEDGGTDASITSVAGSMMVSPTITAQSLESQELECQEGGAEISGGSELNFGATTGFGSFSSMSNSPISADASSKHKGKKVKRSLSTTNTVSSSSSKPSSSKRELRSASRTSKNARARASETAEERKSRSSHNIVEKQYRNRLNAQFESLLHTLPDNMRRARDEEAELLGEPVTEKRVSKGEVLDMARRHIRALEEARDELEGERDKLKERVGELEEAFTRGKQTEEEEEEGEEGEEG